MSNRVQVKNYLEQHVQNHKRYHLVVNHSLHFMDSEFIIREMIDASEDEIDVLYEIFEQMEPNEEHIHQYLEYMAKLYIRMNQ